MRKQRTVSYVVILTTYAGVIHVSPDLQRLSGRCGALSPRDGFPTLTASPRQTATKGIEPDVVLPVCVLVPRTACFQVHATTGDGYYFPHTINRWVFDSYATRNKMRAISAQIILTKKASGASFLIIKILLAVIGFWISVSSKIPGITAHATQTPREIAAAIRNEETIGFNSYISRINGGNGRIRTSGLYLIRVLLCQLSYITMISAPGGAWAPIGRRSCRVVLSRVLPGIRSSIHWTVLLLFIQSCWEPNYFCIGLYLRLDFDILDANYFCIGLSSCYFLPI